MTTPSSRSRVGQIDRPAEPSPLAPWITIGTLPLWEGGSACCLGSGRFAAATIGQVITAPVGAAMLQHFAFALELPDTLAVVGGVFGWDGQQAIGPALFAGSAEIDSAIEQLGEIGFTTGGVAVEPGRQYVLLVTTQAPDGHDVSGFFGIMAGNKGRGYVYINHPLDPSQWSAEYWQSGEYELAFEATFS